MVPITLTIAELQTAASIGVRRQVQNIAAKRRDMIPTADAWSPHIEGACAEAAVAKWLNLYWCGHLGNLRADDVGPLQVRSSTRHDGSLILTPRDADDRAFILVTGVAPELMVRGWIMGEDGKQDRFRRDKLAGRVAFFVPVSALRRAEEMTARSSPMPPIIGVRGDHDEETKLQ